jgi:hypothetical protein
MWEHSCCDVKTTLELNRHQNGFLLVVVETKRWDLGDRSEYALVLINISFARMNTWVPVSNTYLTFPVTVL